MLVLNKKSEEDFAIVFSRELCIHLLCWIVVVCLQLWSHIHLVSWAWWDWPLTWLTNHRPSVLWHCWLGHLTRKIVSEMTHNVSSGTLNTTIPYYTRGVPRGNQNVVKIAIFGITHWLKHRITRKLLNIDRYILRPPKGTSLRKSASFELSTVKIRWGVWPVGELTECVTDTDRHTHR